MAKIYKRGDKWYADYTDASGKRCQRSTKTSIKKDAQRIADKWQQDATLSVNGLADLDRSLESLLNDYLRYLAPRGEKHRNLTETRLRKVFQANGWTTATQINQYDVETTIRSLVDPKTERIIAARTQGHYIGTVKSFTKWLVLVRRFLRVDPMAAVKKPKYTTDRRVVRRFLLPDEWFYLSKTPNAVLYETAIQTGLRASELLSIQPEHLRSDRIELPAMFTKNGEAAIQYITPELHQRLKTALPFYVADRQRLAKLLRRDLRIAQEIHLALGPSNKPRGFLQPTDPMGRTLDFHSLRHTTGAWLAKEGVQPKVIQTVMRHSSITLTLDTYGHLFPGDEREVITRFASVMS